MLSYMVKPGPCPVLSPLAVGFALFSSNAWPVSSSVACGGRISSAFLVSLARVQFCRRWRSD